MAVRPHFPFRLEAVPSDAVFRAARLPLCTRLGLLAVLGLAVVLPLALLLQPADVIARGEACATAGAATATVLTEWCRGARTTPSPAPWLAFTIATDAVVDFAHLGTPASESPPFARPARRAPNESRRL